MVSQKKVSTYEQVNFLEYLLVLAKHKKLIFKTLAVGFVLSVMIALALPNVYVATARILPPKHEGDGFAGALSSFGDLAALANFSPAQRSSELYVGMLESRTISDAIIDKFDLMEAYGRASRIDTYAALQEHVEINPGKESGIVAISIADKNPEQAAEIANAYLDELKKLIVSLSITSASRERKFLTERLEVVKNDLVQAENAFQTFQQDNQAIRIDAQASAVIEAIGQLKGELASKEVKLGVLRSYATEQNAEVKALRTAISQLKGQIRKLEKTPSGEEIAEDVFKATSEIPGLGLKYARLLRNFKVQETLYELLLKQHEFAKIEEAKNSSQIEILDTAVAPDKKSKPRRSLIVLLTTLFSGFIGLLWAFTSEFTANIDEADRARWRLLKDLLWTKKTTA